MSNEPVKQNNQKIELKLLRHDWKYILKKNGHTLSREWVQEKVSVGTDMIETGDLLQVDGAGDFGLVDL